MAVKPEDIPQDVWDAAHAVNIDQLWALIQDDPDDVKLYQDTAIIARAIMTAKAEERERCAKAAEEFAGQFPEFPEFDEQHNCAIYIASVIRGVAEVSTAHKFHAEA